MRAAGGNKGLVVRVVRWTLVAILGVLLLGGAAAATRAGAIRGAVRESRVHASAAVEALRAGDFDGATGKLDDAAAALQRVEEELSHPALSVARVTPLVGGELRALTALTGAAADAAGEIRSMAAELQPLLEPGGRLVPARGRIDLAALGTVRDVLSEAEPALTSAAARAERQLEQLRFGAAREPAGRVVDDLLRLSGSVRDGIVLTGVLPDLLGGREPRTMLLLLQNPAEARGTGGLLGGFAVLEARRGRLNVAAIGSNDDLQPRPGARPVPMPAWYVSRYDRFASRFDWRNANIEPDLPAVAPALVAMFERDRGVRPDSVVLLDAITLEALVDAVGPVSTPQLTFEPGKTARQIMVDSYDRFVFGETDGNAVRKDAMVALTRRLLPKVLDPGNAFAVGAALGTAASDEHLAIWSRAADERKALESLGLGGSFRGDTPLWAGVAVNNGAGNKMDVYVHRSVEVDVRRDGDDVLLEVTATFRMEEVELEALSFYVTGPVPHTEGLAPGEDRLLVAIFLPREAQPIDPETKITRLPDASVVDAVLEVMPGGTAQTTVTVRVPDVPAGAEVSVLRQPAATPLEVQISSRL